MSISTGFGHGDDDRVRGEGSESTGMPPDRSPSPDAETKPDMRARVEGVMRQIRGMAEPILDEIWEAMQRHPDLFHIPTRSDMETMVLTPTVAAILSQPERQVDETRLRATFAGTMSSLYRDRHSRWHDIRGILQQAVKAEGSGILRRGPGVPVDPEEVRDAVFEYCRAVAMEAQLRKRAESFEPEHFRAVNESFFRPLSAADIGRIKHVYDLRLMSDQAFIHLQRGDSRSAAAIASGGGMLHRFVPNKEETSFLRREYRRHRSAYLAPREDLIRKMSGRDGRSGEYGVTGMMHQGRLEAWVSYRLPPEQDAQRARYADQVRAFLRGVQFLPDADREQLMDEAGESMEIDTIATSRPGAGAALLHRVLSEIGGKARNIRHSLLVRYVSMRLVHPKPAVRTIAQSYTPNIASGEFFRTRGFQDVGYVHDPHEIAVRKTSRGLIGVNPTWGLMHGHFDQVSRASAEQWRMIERVREMHERLRAERAQSAPR